MNDFETYYEEVSSMPDDELMEYSSEATMEATIWASSDDFYMEGVNRDAKKDFKRMKSEIKSIKKEIRDAEKQRDYKTAADCCDKVVKLIEEYEKKIGENSGSYVSTILGNMLAGFGNFIILALSAVPVVGIGALIGFTKRTIDQTAGIIRRILLDAKTDDLSSDSFNQYKNMLLAASNEIKAKFKQMKKEYLKMNNTGFTEESTLDGFLEFVSTLNADDPEEAYVIEECLDLMTEEADAESIGAMVGFGLIAAVCIAFAVASFRENSKYKNDPAIKANLEKMKSLQKELKSLGKTKIITPEIASKIKEANAEVKKLSKEIAKREKEIDKALSDQKEALYAAKNTGARPVAKAEEEKAAIAWAKRELERQEAIEKAEREEKARLAARAEEYRRIKAMNTHYNNSNININGLNESAEDYDDLIEFIESADLDDPEQMELVESCLELMQEDFEEDSKRMHDAHAARAKQMDEEFAATAKKFQGDYDKAVSKMNADFESTTKRDAIVGVVSAATCAGAMLAIINKYLKNATEMAKSAGDPDYNKEKIDAMSKQVSDLEKEVAELKKTKGPVAFMKAKTLGAKINRLTHELYKRKLLLVSRPEVRIESSDDIDMASPVDLVQKKLEIYESADAGLITESEKNWLLETLELL